jgi:hypothetical protein
MAAWWQQFEEFNLQLDLRSCWHMCNELEILLSINAWDMG